MRNLKKMLSMVMAFAMICSLMVVGAGAVNYEDFSDKADIVNKEAVNTMVSLGVIDGIDGGYAPKEIVTRGQMAKLIAVMLTGGKDPTLGNITADFTDAKGHWAERYIAYCAQLGIINGYGDGTFGPDNSVTGTAAAKMLLTALGYRSDIEKLTGAGWETNTNVLANKGTIDLFNGIESILPQEGLSRDNTAQMIYSAVQANEVEYKNNFGEYSGVIYAEPKGTILTNRFGVVKVEGVVAANDKFSITGSPAPAGRVRLTDTNGTVKDATGTITGDTYAGAYVLTVSNDLVGKRIVVYVKYQNNLAPNAAASTVIGVPILSNKNVIVETTGKLKDDSKVRDALKGSGISINTTSTTATQAIMVTEEKTSAAAAAVSGTSTAGVQTIPGVKQTFIDHNNDGKVDYIIQIKAGLSKITSLNTKDAKLTLSGLKSIDFVDIANEEDIAKDDFVLVAKFDDTYYLTKATTVTGKVTAYDSSNDKITIDGTAYAIGAGKNLATELDSNPANTDLSAMVDGSYTVYQDAFGNILGYTEGEAAIGNYAVVIGATNTGSAGFDSGKVKLLMSNGTSGTYEVNLLSSAKKWDSSVNTGSNSNKETLMAAKLTSSLKNTIVSYTLDGNNVTIGLPKDMNAKYATATGNFSETLQSSRSGYTIGGTSIMVDDSTAIFILDTAGEYTAVAGLNNLRATGVVTKSASAVYYTAKAGSTNVAKAIFAEVNEAYTTNKNFAYVIDTYTKTVEGNIDIYTYPVVLEDGTMTTLKSKTEDGIKSGYAYSYSLNNGGYAELSLLTGRTINGVVVTDSGKNTVAVAPDTNMGASTNSYPVPAKAQVWNVVDADVKDAGTVYTTKMAIGDKVAIVLNAEGNTTAAFVKGYMSGTMTAAPTGAGLTASSGTFTTIDAKGGTGTWTEATTGLTLQLNLTLGKTQKATLAITGAGHKGTLGTPIIVAGSISSNYVIYTAAANENGGTVTATVTISEPGMTDRVITYVVTVSAKTSTNTVVPTVANTIVSKTGTGTIVAYANSSDPGNADAENHKFTWNGAQATDTLTVALNSLGGTNATVKDVRVDGGLATAGITITKGTILNATAKTIYTVQNKDIAEKGNVILTVTFDDGTNIPTDVVYTFVVNHAVTYILNVPGVVNSSFYATEAIDLGTAGGITGTFTKMVGDDNAGTVTYEAGDKSSYTMPAYNVKGETGFQSVTIPANPANLGTFDAAITWTVDGVAKVAGDVAYAKTGKSVVATITVGTTGFTGNSGTTDGTMVGTGAQAAFTGFTGASTAPAVTPPATVTFAGTTALDYKTGSVTFTWTVAAANLTPTITLTAGT